MPMLSSHISKFAELDHMPGGFLQYMIINGCQALDNLILIF